MSIPIVAKNAAFSNVKTSLTKEMAFQIVMVNGQPRRTMKEKMTGSLISEMLDSADEKEECGDKS